MNSDDRGPAVNRAFLDLLQHHKQGQAINDASAALKQLTAAVQESGKAGFMLIKISLKPASRGSIGTLLVESKVTTKAPEPEVPASIFYADGDYNLTREDPKQTKLNLRVVEAPPAAPLREVSQTEQEAKTV